MSALRVALFGTPGFALPTLEALQREHRLVLVVAQPDRPVGRGLRTEAPPVARRAHELGVPLAQPARLRKDTGFAERLSELDVDVAVTAAYGQILPASLLTVPREGFLNVHASLLPRWRGAAPVQHALIAGDDETGVSIMQTEAGLDTGPVRLQRRRRIEADEDAPELLDALAHLGAQTLLEALALLSTGRLPSEPQDEALVTHAPRLTKEDGRVRWDEPAPRVLDRHRGVAGWPGSWCRFGEGEGETLKVHGLELVSDEETGLAPGTLVGADPAGLRVACSEGTVRLTVVQAPGRARTEARAWANGVRIREGVRLG